MKFSIKTQCFTTRYYVVEAKSKAKAEKFYWENLGSLEEQKEFTREDLDEIISITKEVA
tara:strand:- start:2178 stop:2354 length:177 start_codon:yes stop_codon:yes gene_type:complete